MSVTQARVSASSTLRFATPYEGAVGAAVVESSSARSGMSSFIGSDYIDSTVVFRWLSGTLVQGLWDVLKQGTEPETHCKMAELWHDMQNTPEDFGLTLIMLNGKKLIVVMPAYNAARTLRQTYSEVPLEFVDEVILVDDGSSDPTVTLSKELGLVTFLHKENFGYGRNQKTCYREALKRGADIVVMLHPDYQYSPKLILSLAGMLAYGEYPIALASRI